MKTMSRDLYHPLRLGWAICRPGAAEPPWLHELARAAMLASAIHRAHERDAGCTLGLAETVALGDVIEQAQPLANAVDGPTRARIRRARLAVRGITLNRLEVAALAYAWPALPQVES